MSKKVIAYHVKVTILVMLMIAALAAIGLASALWMEDLYIVGRVETAVWRQAIGSFKVVKPIGYDENRTIGGSIESGGQTLTLHCANISSGWHIWVGLVIQNLGSVPTSVDSPLIGINGVEVEHFDVIDVKTYFYGPYDRGDFTAVWGGVKIDDLPFEGSKNPGEVVLMPNQKAVIWIELEYYQESLIDEAVIGITIRYSMRL
ncbi:MAG: hypothetical protein QW535_02365 [Candidatus Nezhaarchaeales archaeon]